MEGVTLEAVATTVAVSVVVSPSDVMTWVAEAEARLAEAAAAAERDAAAADSEAARLALDAAAAAD